MRRLKKYMLAVVCLVVLSTALIGAVRGPDIYFLIKKNFTIFSEVYREVSLNYVDDVDPQKLMRKGINAMLNTLDPYTVFIDESQNENLEIITRGSYGGVGMDVGVKRGNIVVISPIEGYSAYRKGIRQGDIIKAVNNISVDELSPEEVQRMTVGEPGTSVSMTIERYGMEKQLTFELERERVEVKNIAFRGLVGPHNDIGYISLSRFGRSAASEIRDTIAALQSKKELSGLILDLRNNPGGLLTEAVGIVDKFIEPGLMVVETRGRLNEHNNTFGTEEPALLGDLPLAVLQNGGSASASEIVAGALQDYDRAIILGEQSFGKGLVQIIKPLSYNTAIKITTSRYFIPSGRSIQSVTYTHDKNNTTVIRPDSLKKAFKTRAGRTVYDGQGISPDIEVHTEAPGLLETALRQQSQFFYFVSKYASANDTFTEPNVSQELFEEFKSYLQQNNFDYETQTEAHLKEIAQRLSDQNIDSQVQDLQEAIRKDKEQRFAEQSERLKKILYLELVFRYRGSSGRTEASIGFDPAVERAVTLLNSPKQYKKILGDQ